MFRPAALLLLLFSAFSIAAQTTDEPINTDRPDQSDGTYVMPKGIFQLETGLSSVQVNGGFDDITQNTLLRYGLVKKLELRLLVNEGAASDDGFHHTRFVLYPLTISAKYALCEQHGILPAVSAVGYLQLPFAATKEYQLDYAAPVFLLAFQNDINKRWTLGYNAGISWDGVEDDPFYIARMSLALTVNSKVSVYAEYFGNYASGTEPEHNIDLGICYLLKPRLQLDFAMGAELSSPGDQFVTFLTSGISYRFH